MNFIESSVIAYSFYDNPRKEVCRNFLRQKGITNSLALIEAFNIIEYATNRKEALNAIKTIYKNPFLDVINVDVNVIFEALKRAEKYRLKIFDLIHYVTALLCNCSEFISYDSDFDDLEIKRTTP